MIKRLFISNRGEIALRIIRTAHRMGIDTVLGVSEIDQQSLPAQLADEVALLGPAPSAQSYLDIDRIITAAKQVNADAIHPGYGFLSENPLFSSAVEAAGMIFVGPTAETLAAIGDKLMARAMAIQADLPVVPGGKATDVEEARMRAEETGYPLLIKAVSGGGGRGMKRVNGPGDLETQVAMAMSEAQAAFADPRIYVERFINRGRHIEVQILGDGQQAIHLGDRDCSIQRRFQKLIEEAPAPDIPDDKRQEIRQAGVRLATQLNYRGAGTVEFLVDEDSYDYYFLEMNARIQVEHPVTEQITGIDLIEQQLLIAEGEPLGLLQDDISFTGHAIEARINAEDWMADFRPSPGLITHVAWPAGPGIRVDSHIHNGGLVPPNYDSLVGKLIVSGDDRRQAIDRMTTALKSLRIEGIETTTPMHALIMTNEKFINGAVDTRFFEEFTHG